MNTKTITAAAALALAISVNAQVFTGDVQLDTVIDLPSFTLDGGSLILSNTEYLNLSDKTVYITENGASFSGLENVTFTNSRILSASGNSGGAALKLKSASFPGWRFDNCVIDLNNSIILSEFEAEYSSNTGIHILNGSKFHFNGHNQILGTPNQNVDMVFTDSTFYIDINAYAAQLTEDGENTFLLVDWCMEPRMRWLNLWTWDNMTIESINGSFIGYSFDSNSGEYVQEDANGNKWILNAT